jgi:putative transposase
VRTQLIPTLPESLTLDKLNKLLVAWIDGEYHMRIHSTTGQSPLERYLAHVALLRSAPKDLRDYFRTTVRRKVDKDRTVTLLGKLYEAPAGLIGQTVTLLYHEHEEGRIEIFKDEVSVGFLGILDTGVNSRVRRTGKQKLDLLPEKSPQIPSPAIRGGSLFGTGGKP